MLGEITGNNGAIELFMTIWASLSAMLYWLFDPSYAWVAVWVAFFVSFITKLYQLSIEEGGFRDMLKSRFSSSFFWKKARPKIMTYLFLMVAISLIGKVLPEWLVVGFDSIIVSLLLIEELLNGISHLTSAGEVPKIIKDLMVILKVWRQKLRERIGVKNGD